MSSFGRYVRNTDHVIAHRAAAVTVENARRAMIRAEMIAARNRRTVRIAATIGAALWIAAAYIIATI